MSERNLVIDGIEVLYKPANPLNQSKPPIPELNTRTRLYKAGSVNGKGAMRLPVDIEVMEDVGRIRRGMNKGLAKSMPIGMTDLVELPGATL